MACNCTQSVSVSPSGSALPLVSEVIGLAAPAAVPCGCADTECAASCDSEGSVLPSSWLDSTCSPEGITLLGRLGDRLARLAGNGFIQIISGKAFVVSAVPLAIIDLWHNWWKPTTLSRPILGEPLDAPYQVVADSAGKIHGIKGKSEEDSITYWNSTEQKFQQITKQAMLELLLPTLPTTGTTYSLQFTVSTGDLTWESNA